MKPQWTDQELSDRLRRLSTAPPSTSFEQRLSLSLGLAAEEIRASRLPPIAVAQRGKRSFVRPLLLGLALALAAGTTHAWLTAAPPDAAQPGD